MPYYCNTEYVSRNKLSLQNLQEGDHLEDLGTDRALKWILKEQDVCWIQLAQYSDQWQDLVNMLINLQVL
jgi:hypothetical protein